MCHNVKLLRKFFYINDNNGDEVKIETEKSDGLAESKKFLIGPMGV